MDANTPDEVGLSGALHLANLGYHVFPVRPVVQTDGKVDKPPVRGVMWSRESTTDAATIRRWWARWPDAKPAIDCGKSGIVVLDVDPRHGGTSAGWPDTARYRTLSGGEHLLYREPRQPIGNDNTGKVAPGVDVKGLGGYVVCWDPAGVTRRPDDLEPTPERVCRAMAKNDSPSGDGSRPITPSENVPPRDAGTSAGTGDSGEPDQTVNPVEIDQWSEPVSAGQSQTGAGGKSDSPSGDGLRPITPSENVPPRDAGTRPAPDPFGAPDRSFTEAQALEYVRREAIEPLRGARPGGRNDQLNKSAMTFGHFVPAFWPAEQVTAGLTEVARSIGLQPGEITATIRSGLRAGQREPYRRAEEPAPANAPPESPDVVDALISEMLDTDGLDSIPDPEPLIEGWLTLDTLASIVGKSGKGKSFVTIDMACHIGTGRDWHGHATEKGDVVYIVAEGARGIKRRIRAWERHHGIKATGVRFLPRPVQASSPEWTTLIEACRRLAPVFIVIDTQARVTVGIEENSAKDMGEFIDRAEALRVVTGACVTLVHHTGHQGEEGRGSTAVKGALQSQISVSKQDSIVTVAAAKQKDDVELAPVRFSLVPILQSAVLVGQGETVQGEDGKERFVPVPDPNEVFKGHVQELIGVFLDIFCEGTGGTKAEVRQHFFDRMAKQNMSVPAARKAFNRSWGHLEQAGRLGRTEGSQRYRFITVDELMAGTTGEDV